MLKSEIDEYVKSRPLPDTDAVLAKFDARYGGNSEARVILRDPRLPSAPPPAALPLRQRHIVIASRVDYTGMVGLKKGKVPKPPAPCMLSADGLHQWGLKNERRIQCTRKGCHASALGELLGIKPDSVRQRANHRRTSRRLAL